MANNISPAADSSVNAIQISPASPDLEEKRARMTNKRTGRKRRCYECRRPGHKADSCDVYRNNQSDVEPQTGGKVKRVTTFEEEAIKLAEEFAKLAEKVADLNVRITKNIEKMSSRSFAVRFTP